MIDKQISSEDISSMEQKLGQLEGKVEGIEKTVDSINTAVNGNGRDGLKQTMTRMETQICALSKAASGRGEKLNGLINTNNEMMAILNEHISNKNKHTLTGLLRAAPTKFFLSCIAVYIIGHVILTLVIPKDISIWELIEKLVF